jgi:hypothetical protein
VQTCDRQQDQFRIRQSGFIGLEIVSPRGKVVAWTVDGIVAHVIADRLNELVGVAPRLDLLGEEKTGFFQQPDLNATKGI